MLRRDCILVVMLMLEHKFIFFAVLFYLYWLEVVGSYVSVDVFYALDEIFVDVVVYMRVSEDYDVIVLVFAGLRSLILRWLWILFYGVCLILDCNLLSFYAVPFQSALELP